MYIKLLHFKKYGNRPNLSIVVDKSSLNHCFVFAKRIIKSKTQFEELGGLALGYFDGITTYITKFMYDKNAITSTSSIRFSLKIFTEARCYLRKNISPTTQCIVGTWHVHPPGYGTQYSTIDKECLFQEKWLLETDVPEPKTQKVHLILNVKNKHFDIYTMKILSHYKLNKLKTYDMSKYISIFTQFLNYDYSEMCALLYKKEEKDSDTQVFSILKFRPNNLSNKNLVGFWQHFPYKDICSEYEDIFLEHFHNKTKLDKFYYFKSTGDSKDIKEIFIFKVKRYSSMGCSFDFKSVKPSEESIINKR
ncbi:MAG: hypothetical protein H8D22_03300 [Candidatus Cloacimonetes bacterium]|nr:hypothetical protein [Candidatus Cloacimonadota bacterium]MBL7124341.1 hypothetical protein [Actinomycetota bacterium]